MRAVAVDSLRARLHAERARLLYLRVQYRCSPLTQYGRDLRRRLREPFDPSDYIELERP